MNSKFKLTVLTTLLTIGVVGNSYAITSDEAAFTATAIYKQTVKAPLIASGSGELKTGKDGETAFAIRVTNPNNFASKASIGFIEPRNNKGSLGNMANGSSRLNIKASGSTWSENTTRIDFSEGLLASEHIDVWYVVDGDQTLVAGVYSVPMKAVLWTF